MKEAYNYWKKVIVPNCKHEEFSKVRDKTNKLRWIRVCSNCGRMWWVWKV